MVINCCRMVRPFSFEPVSSEAFVGEHLGKKENAGLLIRLSTVNDIVQLSPND